MSFDIGVLKESCFLAKNESSSEREAHHPRCQADCAHCAGHPEVTSFPTFLFQVLNETSLVINIGVIEELKERLDDGRMDEEEENQSRRLEAGAESRSPGTRIRALILLRFWIRARPRGAHC